MTDKTKSKPQVDRRKLLKSLGTGALGTAAAVTGVAIAPPLAEAAENAAERKKARYKVTDHVKTFYRVNGY